MSFTVGQTVVHPFHGPLEIVEVTERLLRGEPTVCFRMVATEHDLDITVPVVRAGEVGLREIASPERVAELMVILGAPSPGTRMQWSRRMKDYQERLATGRIDELCVVIREITRSGTKAPASSEGQMLRTARARLATELALSLQLSREEADRVIDVALRGENTPAQARHLVDAT